jgi:hypothetical protein
LWADSEKWAYSWHQCRLSIMGPQPWWTCARVVKTLFRLPTSQINCLYCRICLNSFCAHQNMQNSAWIFWSSKIWPSTQPNDLVLLTFRTCIGPTMGLEGALFTFPLCTFGQKIWSSNISPITFFVHKHSINFLYFPLSSWATPHIQAQLQHMYVE